MGQKKSGGGANIYLKIFFLKEILDLIEKLNSMVTSLVTNASAIITWQIFNDIISFPYVKRRT